MDHLITELPTAPSQNDSLSPSLIAGCLSLHLEEWMKIGADPIVLSYIKGVRILPNQNIQNPPPQYLCFNQEQQDWINAEIQRLLDQGSLVLDQALFLNPIFLVPKKGPKKYRLVVDMRKLNMGFPPPYFKMETLDSIISLLGSKSSGGLYPISNPDVPLFVKASIGLW